MLTEEDKKEVVRIMYRAMKIVDQLVVDGCIIPCHYWGLRRMADKDWHTLYDISQMADIHESMEEFLFCYAARDLLDFAQTCLDTALMENANLLMNGEESNE